MDRMADTSEIRFHDYAPPGYHTITPFFAVPAGRGAEALDWYGTAFGAEVLSRMDGEGGAVLHAELLVGDSVMQLSDEIPSMGVLAPDGKTVHGSFAMYVDDPDAVHAAAVAAGARDVSPVQDVFSGDRMGPVMCPYGFRWNILKRVEDVAPEEIERRAREWLAENS
jgi:PhnB protein